MPGRLNVQFKKKNILVVLQTLITSSGGQGQSYRAIFEALLDRGRFEKDTSMTSSLYFKDTSSRMDECQTEQIGFAERWGMLSGGHRLEVSTPVISDIFQQGLCLLSGVELLLKFWRARPAFYIMTQEADPQYKVEVVSARLRVRKRTPQPSVTLAINSALELSPAMYPMLRCEVRQFLIQAGSFSFNFERMFESQVPAILCMAFTTARACAGDYKLNPFNFVHANLENLIGSRPPPT